MKRFTWNYMMARYPAFFAMVLLALALVINLILQPNLLSLMRQPKQCKFLSCLFLSPLPTKICVSVFQRLP